MEMMFRGTDTLRESWIRTVTSLSRCMVVYRYSLLEAVRYQCMSRHIRVLGLDHEESRSLEIASRSCRASNAHTSMLPCYLRPCLLVSISCIGEGSPS